MRQGASRRASREASRGRRKRQVGQDKRHAGRDGVTRASWVRRKVSSGSVSSPARRVLAIVPARGGSKGIPRKNLQLLAGRPLVTHAVDTALAASRVSRVLC